MLRRAGRCGVDIAAVKRMDIRIARTREKKSLEELQWRSSLNNPGDRDSLLANPDAIELPLSQIEDELVFVAEVDERVKGFAAILLREDGNVELDAVFVEPKCWKQGIGRALVEYCASVASSRGASSLHVVGNPHAEGFYFSTGFTITGKMETRFEVGLLMNRAL